MEVTEKQEILRVISHVITEMKKEQYFSKGKKRYSQTLLEELYRQETQEKIQWH